eukprot:g18209.t1
MSLECRALNLSDIHHFNPLSSRCSVGPSLGSPDQEPPTSEAGWPPVFQSPFFNRTASAERSILLSDGSRSKSFGPKKVSFFENIEIFEYEGIESNAEIMRVLWKWPNQDHLAAISGSSENDIGTPWKFYSIRTSHYASRRSPME